MFMKLMTGAVLGTGLLGMAMPASAAATQTRYANLDGNGQVTFVQHAYSWHITTRVSLPKGKYALVFTSEETSNGGVEGSQTSEVCHFAMGAKEKVAGCSNDGRGLAPGWETKTERPDTFVAEIDAVAANGTRTTVLGPVTLG